MKTYIVFLRGINVSGQKKIKLTDLRISLQNSDFENVSTYIQSGNLILNSDEQNSAAIREQIEKLIAKNFGFEVPVLVIIKDKLKSILEAYPFKNAGEKNQYFTLLYTAVDESLRSEFNKLEFA